MKNTAVVVFGRSPSKQIKITKYLKTCCNVNEEQRMIRSNGIRLVPLTSNLRPPLQHTNRWSNQISHFCIQSRVVQIYHKDFLLLASSVAILLYSS